MNKHASNPGRRRFLQQGGALLLSFTLWPHAGAAGDQQRRGEKPTAEPALPGSLKSEPMLDSWIRIGADGAVTVFTGKAELGQGIKTALIQVAAEELVVAPSRIVLITADTERTANEQYTAGSHSMQDSGTALLNAAAQVRAILLDLAAQRLSQPAAGLRIEDGVIMTRDGQRVGYGELVSGQELHVEAAPVSPLRDPSHRFVMGKSLARVDIPSKVSGGVSYVQDLRLPGMLHGRILRPPGPGAALASLDTAPVEGMPGSVRVVRNGSFIGVVARREYEAVQAARALAARARWEETAKLPDMARLFDAMLASRSEEMVILDRGTLQGNGAHSISATYRRPYQMHASIGPSCAIARLDGGKLTVWTHSQGVYPLRAALAEMLGMSKEQVHCIHAEGSGCYGHNGADDVAADAALLARALPGQPVRVQWMREDEHAWEPYGPPMVGRVRASLDAGGNIAEWQYEVWSNTHNSRPGAAGNLLAATCLAQPFRPPPPKPLPQPDGGGDRNAIPLYELPNARVVYHFLPEMPLRVSALRSLGAYCNVFAIESFMDELARASGAEPLAYRIRHMKDARALEVMRLAADKFGWNNWTRRRGIGRGFAFARYKNQGAYAAIAMEVEVGRDTGVIRILKAVAAMDSGEAVNPDGIRNQIEGGIIQSSSWTLSEQVSFDGARITSRDWGGYPILRFPQVPEHIEVHIVSRPGQPFLGTGEAAQGPAAAAIANALADATGLRLRDLPLSRQRVRAALDAMDDGRTNS